MRPIIRSNGNSFSGTATVTEVVEQQQGSHLGILGRLTSAGHVLSKLAP
jgi:hypothetical protein